MKNEESNELNPGKMYILYMPMNGEVTTVIIASKLVIGDITIDAKGNNKMKWVVTVSLRAISFSEVHEFTEYNSSKNNAFGKNVLKQAITFAIKVSDYSEMYCRYCGVLNKRYVYREFVKGILEYSERLLDPYEYYRKDEYFREFNEFKKALCNNTAQIIYSISGKKEKSIKNLWGLLC